MGKGRESRKGKTTRRQKLTGAGHGCWIFLRDKSGDKQWRTGRGQTEISMQKQRETDAAHVRRRGAGGVFDKGPYRELDKGKRWGANFDVMRDSQMPGGVGPGWTCKFAGFGNTPLLNRINVKQVSKRSCAQATGLNSRREEKRTGKLHAKSKPKSDQMGEGEKRYVLKGRGHKTLLDRGERKMAPREIE